MQNTPGRIDIQSTIPLKTCNSKHASENYKIDNNQEKELLYLIIIMQLRKFIVVGCL